MKKNLKSLMIILVVAIAAIYSGCKKDDPASNTDNLCGKDWQMKAATINPAYDFGSGLITDMYNDRFDPCSTDDYMNFSSNGTFVTYDGATKCDPADPDTIGGVWFWNSDETILIRTDNGGTTDSTTITTNDGTTIIGTQSYVENGITYTETYTYKKKS